MASNYPAALDSLSNPDGGDALSTGHAAQHGNVNDAVEAIEGELGTDPAGASATVKARFEAIEANSWVTSARIADGTVTGTDIASGTVTSANLVDGTIVNADVSGTAAIDATKVAGTAVTQADTGTVTSAMIANGTIVNADINAAAAIDKTKISGTAVTTADSGSVTSGMILDGTIVNVDVSAAAAIAATKIAGTAVTQADTGTVTSTMIANGTITGTDIASGTVTSTNILDGTILNADVNAAAAIDISKISGGVTSAGVGNLLTADQASFETTSAGYTSSTATLARSTAEARVGSASLSVTQTTTDASVIGARQTSGVPVTAGQTYTAQFWVKSAATPLPVTPQIFWYLSNGGALSSVAGTVVTSSTSAWTRVLVTAVAPATAAFAAPNAYFTGGTNGDIHYLDCFGFWQGAGGLWSLPGTPIANLGTYTDESVGRRIFTWDTANSRWQMTYGDTGLRDITAAMTAISGVTWNYMYARRMGNLVEIRGKMTTTGAIGAAAAYTVPAGFLYHNSLSNQSWTGFRTVGTTDSAMLSTVAGASLSFQASAAGLYAISCVYSTNDAWPTALPGTASGSIPQ